MTFSQIVFDSDEHLRERDTRPLTEKADPLALSWAAYHVWTKFPERRWVPWSDIEAGIHDHAIAEETRRYYRNRLALRALKSDQEPTRFSQDLYDICNGGIMRECHRGMIYRLPYFYVEDTQRSILIESTQHQPEVKNLPALVTERRTRHLQRHGRIFHSRRAREIMEYWFHDRDTGDAVSWSVAYDNPLRSVIDHWYDSDRPAQVKARWYLGHDRMSEFKYWAIKDGELV